MRIEIDEDFASRLELSDALLDIAIAVKKGRMESNDKDDVQWRVIE